MSNEHEQTIDDARRYVDLAKSGGWVDPDVVPLDMIASLLEAHEAGQAAAVDEAIEEKEAEVTSDHKELIGKLLVKLKIDHDIDSDFETLIGLLDERADKLRPQTSGEVMELLAETIEREHQAAIAAYRASDEQQLEPLKTQNARLDDQLALARAEIRTLKDSPPKRRRNKAGVPSASK